MAWNEWPSLAWTGWPLCRGTGGHFAWNTHSNQASVRLPRNESNKSYSDQHRKVLPRPRMEWPQSAVNQELDKCARKVYMRLRCAGQTVPRAQLEKTKEPAIHDESLRAYVMLLKQERDQAIAAKSRIEKALRSIPGIPADDLIRAGFGVPTDSLNPPVQPNFPIEVMHALRALLNPEILERCGLQLYKDRIRQTATRNVLVEASGVRILRSLLGDTAGPGEEASR